MSTLVAVLAALRPRQWVKNLFVFAGLIFSQSLFTPLVWPALGAFVIFCALSGAIYVFNDLADVEKDRLHPTKRDRPIARGALPLPAAAGLGVLLLAGSLTAAFFLSVPFGVVATAYAGLLTAYSVWLKHIVRKPRSPQGDQPQRASGRSHRHDLNTSRTLEVPQRQWPSFQAIIVAGRLIR